MTSARLSIELLPEERALLLEWTYPFADLASQLSSIEASECIATVTISPYFLRLLIGDLSHAIVKRGCRDAAVIELSDRLEYIDRTGDGDLFYLS